MEINYRKIKIENQELELLSNAINEIVALYKNEEAVEGIYIQKLYDKKEQEKIGIVLVCNGEFKPFKPYNIHDELIRIIEEKMGIKIYIGILYKSQISTLMMTRFEEIIGQEILYSTILYDQTGELIEAQESFSKDQNLITQPFTNLIDFEPSLRLTKTLKCNKEAEE